MRCPMSRKVSIEDLTLYVDTAASLAENISKDIQENDAQVSQDTLDALEAFIEAAQAMEYLTDELKSDKRILN